ncbi:AraC family transcriptional regulator [Holophaga foetida]|uniref:AraC family transcriptional regulator n=1 Tax=Holophaga foetida TaxID=35839 RepID=UPI00024725FA|nr:AraC family transcriptional regulator [Holophaga foetida]
MPQPTLQIELHRILVHYFEDLEAVMGEGGMGAAYAGLLADLRLETSDFQEPSGRLSFEKYITALQWVDGTGRIPGLGLKLGSRKRYGTYGLSGIAVLTQNTLGQVNQAAVDGFEFCWGHFLRLQVRIEGEWSVSRYETSPPSLALCAPLIEQATATGIRLISEAIPGQDWSVCRARFAYPAPLYAHLYRRFLPFECEFGQPANELRIPAAWASLPSALAEESVQDFCTARLQAMFKEEFGRSYLERQIRRILWDSAPDRLPDLPEVARCLEVSERTLRAALAREGTSFRAIQNDIVIRRAQQLLSDPRLSVKEVAFALGFAQPPSFTRAFLKATNETPEHYRSRIAAR